MNDKFISIGTFHYKQAYFLRKQLQLKGLVSFTDSGTGNSPGYDENKVALQVSEADLPQAIASLAELSLELGQNALSPESGKNYQVSKLVFVPVDLSDRAYDLGKSAIYYAQLSYAEIKFHHVYYSSEGKYSSAAYANFQQMKHLQESEKAKLKMKDFAEAMRAFAESIGFSSSLLHFGLSGGNVIEQIADICSRMNPDMVFLGPENPKAADYVAGITRKTVKAVDIPVLSQALKWDYSKFDPKKVIYVAESKDKVEEHLKTIDHLLGKCEKCSVLMPRETKLSGTLTLPSGRLVDLLAIDKIDQQIIDYLLTEGFSGVVVQRPKSGIIARLFGKDVSDAMMQQDELPVLFLP